MKKLLKIMAILVASSFMASCDGTIGYAIHREKTDNHMRRYDTNQEVDDDTVRFVVDKRNQMLMKAEVNGVEDTVLYDSGASSAAILFYTKETKPTGMKFYKVPIMGADKRTKVRTTFIPVNIKTPMSVNELFGNAMLMEPSHSCDKEPSIQDYTIVGFHGLAIGRYSLDFTRNQIYQVSSSWIDSTVYLPVKCKFERDVLFIYPTINGVEYECLFDTGNSGGIILLDAQRTEKPNETDQLYEGSYGVAIGGLTTKQHFVIAPQTTVELAGDKKTMPVMFMGSNLAFNNVGLPYIKHFDWIIDFQYDKVYAKPHVADTMKEAKRARYAVSTADGTLRIMARLLDGNEVFKVGDKIVSVNGEAITEENICYYYDLLTENKDWSEYDIKVK